MRGVGIVFSRFLEVDILTGLLIGMAVVFVYAVLGGMKGITYTQVAQYCVLITAYTVPAVFIAFMLTGNPIPQIAFGSELTDGSGYMLDRLNTVVTDLGFDSYIKGSKDTADIFAITLALMVGTAPSSRNCTFLYSSKGKRCEIFCRMGLIFIALLYTVAPAVGATARLNLMTTIQHGPIGSPEGNLVYENRPDWFKRWEVTKLISFVDKNGDGRIQYYNENNDEFSSQARLWGWQGNELTVNGDIMVLANPEIAHLPDWVIALVAAGAIAAALSTAAGLLLVISAAISHDLIKGAFNPNITEKNELLAGRISPGLPSWLLGI